MQAELKFGPAYGEAPYNKSRVTRRRRTSAGRCGSWPALGFEAC